MTGIVLALLGFTLMLAGFVAWGMPWQIGAWGLVVLVAFSVLVAPILR